jgi:hypothetical protein
VIEINAKTTANTAHITGTSRRIFPAAKVLTGFAGKVTESFFDLLRFSL